MNPDSLRASGKIPAEAEFFQDHFPDFPILPGVLGVDILVDFARRYLNSLSHCRDFRYRVLSIRMAKFSAYLRPGDTWESQLNLLSRDENKSNWTGRLMTGGRTAVSCQWEMLKISDDRTKEILEGGSSL